MKKSIIIYLAIFLYLIFGSIVYFYLNGKSLIGIDDANIYFVYMKNLAEGFGFVFNQGGEKVEGFTSLFYTLIGAGFFKIFQNPNIALIITNIILLSVVLYEINSLLNYHFKTKYSSRAFLLLLGLLFVLPGFLDWTILSLLETGLWCFLVVIFSLQIINYNASTNIPKHYIKTSVLIILMIISRPESMILALFFIFFNIYKEFLITKNIKKSLSRNLVLVAIYVISLFLLINWRLHYFGFPLPNTFYAKVSKSLSHNLFLGLKYVVGFLLYNPIILLILVFDVIFMVKLLIQQKMATFLDNKNFTFFFLFAIFLVTLFIPFYTGGDYFANYRFMQPTIPLIILSFFYTDFVQKLKLNYFKIAAIVVLAFFTSYHNYNIIEKKQSKLWHEFEVAKVERYHSYELNKLFSVSKKYPSQGVMAAGGCGFVYKGKTMDMLGLNYIKMAHAKKENSVNVMKNHASFSRAVFYEEEPDLFWIAGDVIAKNDNPEALKVSEFNKVIFKGIEENPEFKKDYANCIITRKGFNKKLRIFAKKAFLDTLDKNIFNVVIVDDN